MPRSARPSGDTYLIAQQVANPVTSGVNAYPWKIEIQVYYSSNYIDRITSGTIFVDCAPSRNDCRFLGFIR